MEDKKTALSVSTEVLEKMAEIAAKEVDGVAGLSKKAMDIKGIVKTINGAIEISVYICLKADAKVKETAERVQENIKDKIQTMTGSAVTKVNVQVADIEIKDEE